MNFILLPERVFYILEAGKGAFRSCPWCDMFADTSLARAGVINHANDCPIGAAPKNKTKEDWESWYMEQKLEKEAK